MKLNNLLILVIITFILSVNSSFALIKIDKDSIDLAIKYGLKSKGLDTKDFLDSNWINDGNGRILNIYSPFIQIASKTTNQTAMGTTEEDIKNVKNRLITKINKIMDNNEVRFLVALYGDSENFAKNYKAYIIDASQSVDASKESKKINPKKSHFQQVAEKDGFVREHPYSAVNCYTFKFDNLFNLKEYYFILKPENGEEIKYYINNEKVF